MTKAFSDLHLPRLESNVSVLCIYALWTYVLKRKQNHYILCADLFNVILNDSLHFKSAFYIPYRDRCKRPNTSHKDVSKNSSIILISFPRHTNPNLSGQHFTVSVKHILFADNSLMEKCFRIYSCNWTFHLTFVINF